MLGLAVMETLYAVYDLETDKFLDFRNEEMVSSDDCVAALWPGSPESFDRQVTLIRLYILRQGVDGRNLIIVPLDEKNTPMFEQGIMVA